MEFREIVQEQLPKVICFGEALLDRLGPLGGDPSIDKSVQDCLGGAPANVACALARLGIDVGFIGRLGDDKIGTDFSNLMIQRRINIQGLQIDPSLPSRVVLVCRDINGERSFGGFAGDIGHGFADEAIDLGELSKEWSSIAPVAEWLLVGTIPLAFQASSQSLFWCIEKAVDAGIRIAIDINWRPIFWDANSPPDIGPNQLAKDTIQPLLNTASLLKLSKEEANWFFDTSNPSDISSSLPNHPDVVVTDGALPIRWQLNNCSGTIEVPNSLKIVDTTGAGDCFTAGLLCKLLQSGQSLGNQALSEDIVRFASASGALVCLGAGAIDPQPTYGEVKDFLVSDLGEKS
tara:strand:- start:1038 stop:2078 length:1041 start_codon:yes stop_codon:yes gene_type:complete